VRVGGVYAASPVADGCGENHIRGDREDSKMRLLAVVAVLFAAVLVMPGCDESDASNVRIKVNADFSGEIRATRMVIPDEAAATQAAGNGVSWTAAAQVVTSAGTFAKLSDVRIEDMTFSAGRTNSGMSYLRVTLPRGGKAAWPAALTAPDADKRRETNNAIFPRDRDSRLGSVIAVRLELPADPISQGFTPQIGGVTVAIEKRTVTMSIPVAVAMRNGPEIVWDMTWRDEPAGKAAPEEAPAAK